MMPAPPRRADVVDPKEDDVIEIHYCPEEEFAEDTTIEAETRTENGGLEGDKNEAEREESAYPERDGNGAGKRCQREQLSVGSRERWRVVTVDRLQGNGPEDRVSQLSR